MTDLDEHIRRRLDRVPAPDLWPAIQDRVPTATPRRRPPRRSLVGAGALATVLAVVLVVTVVVRDDGRDQQELQVGGREVPTSTTAALPPPSGPRIVSSVTVDGGVGPMTAGFGSVWVGSSLHRTLVRIDPATNETLATISLGTGTGAVGLAVGEGAVWAVGGGDAANPRAGPLVGEAFLMRIDPRTNTVSARLPLEGAYGVAVGPGAIWVASARDHLWRVDPVRMEVTARIAIDLPLGVAATADAVWVTGGRVEGMVERVDPSRNVVTASIATGRSSGAVATVAIGTQLVWVGSGDGTVTGIDPATNTVRTTLRVGRGLQSLADDGDGTLWVASSPIPTSPSSPTPTSPSTILRVDVATGKSSPPLDVGPQVTGVAFFDGALWVGDRSRGSVLKIQ